MKPSTFEQERDMAEIQLVAVLCAIRGVVSTQPNMTVVELNKILPHILKFAREAELDSRRLRENAK